ncbi:MAG TPA: class I tRNA ligase family protein, partial [Polyangiaceae bacterium]|nr:class I tRNA ligase family protein [Polyangiaceae bacterium]
TAAIDAVNAGRTQIIPAEWKKTYDHFLENIQDWCVSRQLWWGHQIPAWHNAATGEIVVARSKPEGLPEGFVQDPDVLDTWFSSALWPFSTLGWPDRTAALAKFYPTNPAQTSDLETGYDILFFWVARMMMFGLHFMGEVPFRRVLLSGLIVDETGEKMSKVKGNVIDPLDLVSGTTFADMVKKTLPGAPEDEALAKFKKAYPSAAAMGGGFPAFGADAVRFTLATYPPSNKRIALALKRIEGNRHFLNKIWNATRLALELLGDYAATEEPARPRHFANRWIRSRFAASCDGAEEGLDGFRVDEAAQAAYRFFWNDFCDWYLELVKPILRRQGSGCAPPEVVHETRQSLAYVLEGSLRLMHPLMPFITEELWQRVPRPASRKVSVAFGPYPTKAAERQARDEAVEKRMETLQSVVSAARTERSEWDVDKKAEVEVRIRSDNAETLAFLEEQAGAVALLVRTRGNPTYEAKGERPSGFVRRTIPTGHGAVDVAVNLRGLVTAEQLDARQALNDRRLAGIEKTVAALKKKLDTPGFLERAKPEAVAEAKAELTMQLEVKAQRQADKELVGQLKEELAFAGSSEARESDQGGTP